MKVFKTNKYFQEKYQGQNQHIKIRSFYINHKQVCWKRNLQESIINISLRKYSVMKLIKVIKDPLKQKCKKITVMATIGSFIWILSLQDWECFKGLERLGGTTLLEEESCCGWALRFWKHTITLLAPYLSYIPAYPACPAWCQFTLKQ